jgi:hypothetical protein
MFNITSVADAVYERFHCIRYLHGAEKCNLVICAFVFKEDFSLRVFRPEFSPYFPSACGFCISRYLLFDIILVSGKEQTVRSLGGLLYVSFVLCS